MRRATAARIVSVCLLLLATVSQTAGAQNTETIRVRTARTTLRTDAAENGFVWIQVPPQGEVPRTLSALARGSALILEGRVINERVHLSADETLVVTDYTVEVMRAYKDETKSVRGGSIITVQKPGGNLVLDGHPVRFDTLGFAPLDWIAPHLFFLITARPALSVPEDPGSQPGVPRYEINSLQAGVYAVEKGVILCRVPDRAVRSLCGLPEHDFDSELMSVSADSAPTIH